MEEARHGWGWGDASCEGSGGGGEAMVMVMRAQPRVLWPEGRWSCGVELRGHAVQGGWRCMTGGCACSRVMGRGRGRCMVRGWRKDATDVDGDGGVLGKGRRGAAVEWRRWRWEARAWLR